MFYVLLFLLQAAMPIAFAGTPSWALHDTTHLDGRIFRTVCSGIGPNVGYARQEAVDSCKVSAAQYVVTDLTMNSLSVTSERQGVYHGEVLKHARISGLVCQPKREEIEETDDKVQVWVLCEFDLSRTKAHPNRRNKSFGLRESEEFTGQGEPEWIRNRMELEKYNSMRNTASDRSPFRDKNRVLTLAVIPMCMDLIVRGNAPARTISCDRNPISIPIRPEDRTILVRSIDHFPKTILLAPSKDPRGYAKVILEPVR